MSLKSLQQALELQRSLMRVVEGQKHWRRLVAPPSIPDILERTHVLEMHLQSIVESSTSYQRSIESHVQRANEMAAVIESIAKSSWLATLEKVTMLQGTNTLFAKVSDDLARHQSRLDAVGVRDAIHPTLHGLLKDFGKGQVAARLSLIASASTRLHTIRDQESFARVGTAVIAAGLALSDENIGRRDHSKAIDSFFGDWGRLTQLPEGYGHDEGVRRETLQEVEADEALLDVSTEEAAALFSQSSFSASGIPIVLLGEPIGLVVTRDPDDVAARLIRRTERALRGRIDRAFRAKHGDNWPAVLMPERAASWSKKREIDEENNLPLHDLVYYAEFSELADILKGYWSDSFAGRGPTLKKVMSRIRALSPHRNYEFHSRPVTAEQLLTIAYCVRMLEPFLSYEDAEDDDK